MINRDARCVYVADSPVMAELVAARLDEHGVPAEVMDRNTLGGLEGLTPWSSTGVSARGIEIWVKNAADAGRARELLERDEEMRAARNAVRQKATGTIQVTCEDCGNLVTFPASQQGTVDNCPHCGSYIDVEPEREDDPASYEANDDDDEEGPSADPDTRIKPA